MNVYCVKAIYPEYGAHVLVMIIYHEGSKADVAAALSTKGWKVQSVKGATMADLNEVQTYDDVRKFVKEEVARKRQVEAENARRAEAARRAQEEAERQAAEHRRRAEEDARMLAISEAAGDLLGADLEPELAGNAKLAALCAKTLLFFDQAGLNRRDLFTAISIDFADFESQTSCPQANKMLGALLRDLTNVLRIDEEIAKLDLRVREDRASAEGQLNSIGSRTHVYGGSGEMLLLSMWAASSAAREDERAMQSIQSGYEQRVELARRAVQQGRLQQQYLEFRAKTAVSLLLVACGKSKTIDVSMPPDVQRFVLTPHA